MKFTILIATILAAMAGWSVWWWIGASGVEDGLEDWLAARRAEGWQAEAEAIDVSGYPNRFDARLTELRLADPESGWAWAAPIFDLYQIAYDPGHVIVVWPPEQTVSAPGAAATLRAETLRASLVVAPTDALRLVRASLEAERAALDAEAGWTAGLGALQAHLRESDTGPPNTYQVSIEAEGVRPPAFLSERADPTGSLPAMVERLSIEGRAAFDRPLDRPAAEGLKPYPTALSIARSEAVWGDLSLSAEGRLTADAEGYAAGEIELTARNWKAMLDAAAAAGAIQSELAGAIKIGLGFLAGFGGDGETLTAPLTFSGGAMRIGPVPIGAAPRMIPKRRLQRQ